MIYNHSDEADIKIHLKASYTLYQGHHNKIKELETKASIQSHLSLLTHLPPHKSGMSDSDTRKWS